MLLTAFASLAAVGAALSPNEPAARQVVIFAELKPYFSCLRTRMNPPVGEAARTGQDAVTTIRAYAAAAEASCEASLAMAMKRLKIIKPTVAALGERVNAVRWRKMRALQEVYHSSLMQAALETYHPAGWGTYPQVVNVYDATVTLLPYFSCFEDAFRRQPAAFSKDHAAIRNARKAAETSCASIRPPLMRKAGLHEEAPLRGPDPHWWARSALMQFEEGIVTYQLQLNNASPAPRPPVPPPDPVPSRK